MVAHVGGGTLTVATSGSAWAQVYPGAGGMTLITSGTLSGASVVLSSIPGTYRDLRLVIRNYLPATDNIGIQMRVNGDSGANRYRTMVTTSVQTTFNSTLWNPGYGNDNAVAQGLMIFEFFDYANATTWKVLRYQTLINNPTTTGNPDWDAGVGLYNQTAAISSITVFPSSGNFTSGDYLLYGVQ
jgi:hypothetical protein